MMRILLASSGALFLGSIGAFFLFVPLMSIATVELLLIAFILMFWIGVQVGAQPALAPASVGEKANSRPE